MLKSQAGCAQQTMISGIYLAYNGCNVLGPTVVIYLSGPASLIMHIAVQAAS